MSNKENIQPIQPVICEEGVEIIDAQSFLNNPNGAATRQAQQEAVPHYCTIHCREKCQAKLYDNIKHVASGVRLQAMEDIANKDTEE